MMDIEVRRRELLSALEGSLYNPIDFKFGGYIKSGKEKRLETSAKLSSASGKMSDENDKEGKSSETPLLGLTRWPRVYKIGPGLYNSGNTCFLNSVLQCLTYTPPLAAYFLTKPHKSKCSLTKSSTFCAFCFMEDHINRTFTTNERAVVPTGLVKNLKLFGSNFRLGRQSDAHEFMVMLIDKMQYHLFGNPKKLDRQLAESSILAQIFSGRYKSTVECLSCGYKSEIFERFYDLSLDLQGAETVDKCLNHFFRIEKLEGPNKYNCSGCKKAVNATKRFTLDHSPVILTLQLKRFNNFCRKIPKHIVFEPTLNLSRFFSYSRNVPQAEMNGVGKKLPQKGQYELYAVLVHQGSEIYSGHYYSFVKNSNNLWYEMNDERVTLEKLDDVLKERAYLLFYRAVLPDTAPLPSLPKTPKIDVTPPPPTSNLARSNSLVPNGVAKPSNMANIVRHNSEITKSGDLKVPAQINGIQRRPSEDSILLQTPLPQLKVSISDTQVKHLNDILNEVTRAGGNESHASMQTESTSPLIRAVSETTSNSTPKALPFPSLLVKRPSSLLWRSKLQTLKFFSKLAFINVMKRKRLQLQEAGEEDQTRTRQMDVEAEEENETSNKSNEDSGLSIAKAIITEHMLTKRTQLVKTDSDWTSDGKLKTIRNKMERQNKDFTTVAKKERDEYDKEYDRGKLKKVKKKKVEASKHKKNLFQNTYEYKARNKKKVSAAGNEAGSNGINGLKQNKKKKKLK